MTDARDELVRSLAGLALFADLRDADLWAIADPEKERLFGEGERVLRRGLSGGGFFVILDGEAAVEIPDGEPRRLAARRFLRGGLDPARVQADRRRRRPHAPACLEIPGPQLEELLLTYPHVTYRMLQTMARRIRDLLE